MELLRNILPILILGTLLLLAPSPQVVPYYDIMFVFGMTLMALLIGGILVLFG